MSTIQKIRAFESIPFHLSHRNVNLAIWSNVSTKSRLVNVTIISSKPPQKRSNIIKKSKSLKSKATRRRRKRRNKNRHRSRSININAGLIRIDNRSEGVPGMRRYGRTDSGLKKKRKEERRGEVWKKNWRMNNTRCLKVYLTCVRDHDAHDHSRLPFKSSFTLHSARSSIVYHAFHCGPRFAPSTRGKKIKTGFFLSCSKWKHQTSFERNEGI